MEANPEVEKRLRALARQRRRMAEALPGMSVVARDRLQAEVGRRREGEGVEVGLTESVPDGPQPLPGWMRGKAWLPWLGVAAAAAALVWMVWFPDPRGGGGGGGGLAPVDVAHHTVSVPPVEDWNAPEALTMGEGSATEAWRGPPPAALAAPVASRVSGAAAGGGVGESGTDRVLALPVRPAAGVEPARKAWTGGVRWRQSYQVTSGGEVPSFLGIFECVRSGDGLELRAADGTVFKGRVTELPAGAGGGGGWVYEAQGQPMGWGSEVAMTLQWDQPEASGDGAGEGGYLEWPVRATLLWGGTNVVELRAEPSGDG
jgi:hypothetical protein